MGGQFEVHGLRVKAFTPQPGVQRGGELHADRGAVALDARMQRGWRAFDRHEDELPGQRRGGDDLEVRAQRAEGDVPHRPLVIGAGEHPGELADRPPGLAVEQGVQQTRQVLEVAVDDGPRDPRLARHRVDRHGAEALARDELQRLVEQLLTARLAGHAGGSGHA
ncbi:hypothetical protein LRS13_00450 [Svornostia abyssi]|uniref:Uncharacterized protein n=1 Tax=Svornostia abyssi TaxID=2898438 RepID=A0ABY5PHA4_9ACTN|nr:hypothetical protein LRS13_00450 [Parviterribacteraceae bacterium J379]